MEELEIYKGLRKIALKQLGELNQKGSMSVSEAEAAKTAMCLIDMIDGRTGEKEEMDEGYSGRRSYHDEPYRRYNITAYGDMRTVHDDYYGDESYRRGMRRGSYDNQMRDDLGRYSSHSIDDRVVDALEHMVDSAKSDYEHQKLMEYIRYVRSKERGE